MIKFACEKWLEVLGFLSTLTVITSLLDRGYNYVEQSVSKNLNDDHSCQQDFFHWNISSSKVSMSPQMVESQLSYCITSDKNQLSENRFWHLCEEYFFTRSRTILKGQVTRIQKLKNIVLSSMSTWYSRIVGLSRTSTLRV